MSIPTARSRVGSMVQTGINRLLWLISRRGRLHGIATGVPWSDPERTIAATKLRLALDLIHVALPRMLNRMKGDLAKILVTDVLIADGQFDPNLRMCMLDESYVCKADVTPSHVATVLIHEATHARLHAVGIGYPVSLRPRIERLCMRQELELAKQLPDGPRAALRAERGINLPDSTWGQPALVDRRIAVIRSWGWPEWIVRVIERTSRGRAA